MRLTSLNDLLEGDRKIDGVWRLGPNHKIQYRRRGKEQEAAISGELLAAEPTGLAFRVTERSTEEEVISRTLTLRGRWEADARNRLNFLVERQSDRNDRLTLSGGWEVGETHELLYRFKRLNLKTKSRDTHTLTFRGHWDLTDGNRLTYVLDKDSDSMFRFRGTWQTPSLMAKEGQIRYQVGVEVEGRRKIQTVLLFGKWKLSQDLSLDLEVPYGNGTRRPICFSASYSLDSRSNLQAELMGTNGQPLGLQLAFTREFLKGQGKVFLRLYRSLKDQGVEAGVRLRW